jgi:hypothetical protein
MRGDIVRQFQLTETVRPSDLSINNSSSASPLVGRILVRQTLADNIEIALQKVENPHVFVILFIAAQGTRSF